MPLTNAQKQARFAARRKAKLERLAVLEGVYEQACRALLEHDAGGVTLAGWRGLRAAIANVEARKALGDVG